MKNMELYRNRDIAWSLNNELSYTSKIVIYVTRAESCRLRTCNVNYYFCYVSQSFLKVLPNLGNSFFLIIFLIFIKNLPFIVWEQFCILIKICSFLNFAVDSTQFSRKICKCLLLHLQPNTLSLSNVAITSSRSLLKRHEKFFVVWGM